MATETTAETASTSTEETSGQEENNTNTDTSSQTTSEPEGNGQQQESSTTQQAARLPDDHPLVTALERQKQVNTELKAKADKVEGLETKIRELTDKSGSTDAVQAKYDRLESFLTKVGGPLSKALDSRSFTTALFESDEDIDSLVTKWHKDNPSATSSALQSGTGSTKAGRTMNDLLRSAAQS